MMYAGRPGFLIPLKCAATLTVADEIPATYRRTLDGSVKAQIGTKSRRTWSVSMAAANPTEIATFRQHIRTQPMPWVWVTPEAAASNILTPEQASLDGPFTTAVQGGIVPLDGGGWARSVNGGSIVVGKTHVIPGMPVTVGIHARPELGGGLSYFRIRFWDVSGSELTADTVVISQTLSPTGPMERMTISVPAAPATAATCSLHVSSVSTMAGPTVSWTETPSEWADGDGCDKVVIAGHDRQVIMAVPDRLNGRIADASFTVVEVG